MSMLRFAEGSIQLERSPRNTDRSVVPGRQRRAEIMYTVSEIQCRFSNGVLMKLTRDIQSLSTFKRDTAKIVRQLKKTGQPVVLTVNGKAELVIQDAESYQKLLEAQDRMEAIEGIRRGLESMKRNAGKPAERFFREFFAEKGISERE